MYQYAVCGGEVGRGAPSYDFAIFCGKPYYSIKNNLALREGSPGYLPRILLWISDFGLIR